MSKRRILVSAAIGFGAIGVAAPLQAAELIFIGSANATATVSASAACTPLPFRGIVMPQNSSGTSNLGSFTYSHDACTQGATGPVTGTFALDFGGSLLNGAFDGLSVARAGVAGLFDQQFTYNIAGGTGIFDGASGSFVNIGTVDVRGGPPSRLALNFNGLINAPAVPEPASWAMMLIGFGISGAAMRRRGQKVAVTYA
ncbi:PEPxxWA-CTERM sorting domain-containing protein [Novosphingobium sp. Gsoil 351]|uniref:PEPxxWA-CTERM sorting domain-containing protein n=1 Tax=Novosphingobium sp. Gsoil 351 TaxID=2675225 RepID=UPI0012B46C43|nr:PEPxxWA-CTERM sorting domain-containing protein [Novosphingobium sp. Gsoil 351]QGN56128.1 PEPxxWA-CTERM sorting domain-containing protein [Novosphingobium sp. Gsoil 351]